MSNTEDLCVHVHVFLCICALANVRTLLHHVCLNATSWLQKNYRSARDRMSSMVEAKFLLFKNTQCYMALIIPGKHQLPPNSTDHLGETEPFEM